MRRKHGPASTGISEETALNLGYYYSTVEAHLKSLSAQTGGADSLANLAYRLAQLLETTAVREQHGNSAMVSEVWPNGNSARARVRAAFNNGFATGQADVGPHGNRTLSAKARKAISKAQRKRWAKFHANQRKTGWTPERRAKYSKMMKAKWADPKTGKKLRKEAASRRGRIVSPETRAKISAAQKANFERGAA